MAKVKASAAEEANTAQFVKGEYVRRKPLHELFAKAEGKSDVASNSMAYEDEFHGRYGGNTLAGGVAGSAAIIAPPYLPRQLESLVQTNNSLGACIDAMVTNVHETGFVIEYKDPAKNGPKLKTKEKTKAPGGKPEKPVNDNVQKADTPAEEVDPKVKEVTQFFDEVWPGMSFQKLRKELGHDIERTGNGYIEVIRNLLGEVVMLRRMDPKLTRMCLLSAPNPAQIVIRRGEKDVKVTVPMRYRRFVQSIGVDYVYFKEFGCPMLLHKKTGQLLAENKKAELIKEKALGSEVIHFVKTPDVETPYGVPQWVSQMPSVLGSRKAEEHNLDYFASGGVPPLMIFVHGGMMAQPAKDALQEFLASTPGAKQGAPVFEVIGTGGGVDSANAVRVTVERFGNERQKDSMFEMYDKRCEERVRRAWRLPPIFVGQAADYSFATAHASYAVGEAQVFKPERDEFDGVVNSTIMRELDPTGELVFRSKGVPVKDVEQQMKALDSVKEHLEPSHIVESINEIAGTNFKPRDGVDDEMIEDKTLGFENKRVDLDMKKNPPVVLATAGPGKVPAKAPARKADGLDAALILADEVFTSLVKGERGEPLMNLLNTVSTLGSDQLTSFKGALSERVLEGEVSGDSVSRFVAMAVLMKAFE